MHNKNNHLDDEAFKFVLELLYSQRFHLSPVYLSDLKLGIFPSSKTELWETRGYRKCQEKPLRQAEQNLQQRRTKKQLEATPVWREAAQHKPEICDDKLPPTVALSDSSQSWTFLKQMPSRQTVGLCQVPFLSYISHMHWFNLNQLIRSNGLMSSYRGFHLCYSSHVYYLLTGIDVHV